MRLQYCVLVFFFFQSVHVREVHKAKMLLSLHSTVQIKWMKRNFQTFARFDFIYGGIFLVGRFLDHVHKLRDLLFGHVRRVAVQMRGRNTATNKEHRQRSKPKKKTERRNSYLFSHG